MSDARLESLWFRELLTLVAQDLEHLAADPQRGAYDRTLLHQRAMRIRQRMHEGPPAGWSPTRLGDSERDAKP